MKYDLPGDSNLRIGVFAGLFDNVTASYKYLFFISILKLLQRNSFQSSKIALKDIELEMLAIAWYPYVFYKLNFGFNDQTAVLLDSFTEKHTIDSEDIVKNPDESLRQKLKLFLEDKATKSTLLNMVPYRLISMFVNSSDYDRNRDLDVIRYTIDYANEEKPLYYFNEKKKSRDNSITIHPHWCRYIETNSKIIEGFAYWEWLQYMQKRNPNAFNIGEKLLPPDQRSPLTLQTKFWKYIIQNNNLHCIYSGQKLTDHNLSIDHYLPWSFLAHDREWNLIPVDKNINSAKSNKLPSNKYLEAFVNMQHIALKTAINNKEIITFLKEKNYQDYLNNYKIDLGINEIKSTTKE
jgi:hypothetical protein